MSVWLEHLMRSKRKALRQRILYWRPAGEWVGFGADTNTQPDLFESVYRVAWWRVAVCRVCLVAAIRNANAFIEQAEALLIQTRKKVGK
jgi:hypothetical protein